MMTPLTPQFDAYVKAARKYYREALNILPEDPYILCGYATASLATDGDQEMQHMYLSDQAHFALAEELSDSADRFAHPDEGEPDITSAAVCYRTSLKEYERAISRVSSNVNALNNYAYTTWRWRLMAVDKDKSVSPDASILHQAEEYARRAAELTEVGPSRTLHALTKSTLGEVLLAQARPYEAIEVLNEVILPKTPTPPVAGSHAFFDEVRWDLAQAYLCAKYNDPDSTPKLLENAVQPFDQIRDNEISRERRFLEKPYLLDPAHSQSVCRWTAETAVEGTPDDKGPLYELERSRYSHNDPCQWLGVFGDAVDQRGKQVNPEGDRLDLHVWGGGVDQRISVGEPGKDVWLSSHPKPTRYYYFAQLERGRAEGTASDPVSTVYPLRTSADCQENRIWLTFKRVRD